MPREAPVTNTARPATAASLECGPEAAVRVLGTRIGARPHLRGEGRHRPLQHATQVGVPLHEPRRAPATQASHVLPDEHLRITVGTGADADRRDQQLAGDALRHHCRHHLEHHREGTGRLQSDGVFQQLVGGVAPTLHPVAAERMLALWGEAEVRHPRNPRRDERLDLRGHPAAALQLHRVRAGLLHEPDRGGQRLLRPGLVRPERQVGDDERPRRRGDDRAGQRDQLVDGDPQRRLVAVDIVGGGFADEEDRHAGRVEDSRRVLLVRGQHRPALAALLCLAEVVDPHPPGRGPAVEARFGHRAPSLLGARSVAGPRAVHPSVTRRAYARDVASVTVERLRTPGVELVTVVEIEPAVVRWHRSYLARWSADAMHDPRVDVVIADLGDWLRSAADRYDAICLDVDNGPEWTVTVDNEALYRKAGLDVLARRLVPDGTLAVWSSNTAPAFEALLRSRFATVHTR